jgi:hypothetical protein
MLFLCTALYVSIFGLNCNTCFIFFLIIPIALCLMLEEAVKCHLALMARERVSEMAVLHNRPDLPNSKANLIYGTVTAVGFGVSQCVLYLALLLEGVKSTTAGEFLGFTLVLVVFFVPKHCLAGYNMGLSILKDEMDHPRDSQELPPGAHAVSIRGDGHNTNTGGGPNPANTLAQRGRSKTQWSHVKPGFYFRTLVYMVLLLSPFLSNVVGSPAWQIIALVLLVVLNLGFVYYIKKHEQTFPRHVLQTQGYLHLPGFDTL